MPPPALLVLLVAAGLVVLVGGSILAHARAVGSATPSQRPVAVVVLGYPSRRNGRAHPLQRWRCRLAVRTVRSTGAERVVFAGGNPTNGRTEAEVMAELAAGFGLGGVSMLLEDTSISTWQNVAQSMPLVTEARSVVLVSDPLHAARARSYWLRQQPHDADRVFVSAESSLFDHWWLKVPTAVHELMRALFDRTRSARRANVDP